jgi:hypothetical protein|tara:strand:+ start:9324 stop:9638 length:315 start_codon:yes stop_codon:yes gene_type:complete
MELIENKTNSSRTRYSYGYTVLEHRGKRTTTSVGSNFDQYLPVMYQASNKEGRIPPECGNRPDAIADIFYDSPGYWWYVMQYNGISDPFEQLNRGDRILIPELR